MNVQKITTHITDALNRLLHQYRGLPGYQGFFEATVQQIQDLEDAIYDLAAGRQLWSGSNTPAFGAQLDKIGTLVGIARNGLSDEQYILFIFGKIAENFSDTTIPTILTIIGYLFQADSVQFQDIYPAGIYIVVVRPGISSSLFSLAKNLVQNALGAGIDLLLAEWGSDNVFRFSGAGVGSQNGFADVNVSGSGGLFVGLL